MQKKSLYLILCITAAFSSARAQSILNFDPSVGEQHVKIPGITCPSELSFEAWVYANPGVVDYRTILEFGDDAPWFGLELDITDTNYFLTLFDIVYDSFAFPMETWVHVAGIYSTQDSLAKIYVNGALRGIRDSVVLETGGIGAGIAYNGSDDVFNGLIDDVRIWDGIRTESEIFSNMHACLNGNESGLYAFYNFDEGEGSIAHDLSGNNFDGILMNMDTTTAWISYTLCFTASVYELRDMAQINSYPNPAGHSICISGLGEAVHYKICNVMGVSLLVGTVSNDETIMLDELLPGMYYIRIDDRYNLKFVKQ